MNGFYKDTKNLIQLRKVFTSQGTVNFTAYQNEDFATSKGIELTLELRRTNRLSAKVNYTLSDARGTGNSSASNSVAVGDESRARFPSFTAPLIYNQTHRGNVTLDYRYGKGEGGPILEGMGVYALLSFNSGHNFTKIQEPTSLGQSSPWNVGIRALLDARNRYPVDPPNASTTPWVFNIDLNWNKVFFFGDFNFELYVNVLNVLNTKHSWISAMRLPYALVSPNSLLAPSGARNRRFFGRSPQRSRGNWPCRQYAGKASDFA